MERRFTTYQIAKDVKELGFNEPCLAYYGNSTLIFEKPDYLTSSERANYCFGFKERLITLAPTWGQAIDFLLQEIKTKLNYGYGYTVFHDGTYIFKSNGISSAFDNKEEFVIYLINLLK